MHHVTNARNAIPILRGTVSTDRFIRVHRVLVQKVAPGRARVGRLAEERGVRGAEQPPRIRVCLSTNHRPHDRPSVLGPAFENVLHIVQRL